MSLTFIAVPPEKAETTDPASMTKYEGVTCKVKTATRNSLIGAKAVCEKDPKCWAVEARGNKASYCKGRKGGHIFTKIDGLVNLKEENGKVVWIKDKN